MSDKKQIKGPSPKKKAFSLIRTVSIDGKSVPKGEKVNLTEEGRRVFKSKNRI